MSFVFKRAIREQVGLLIGLAGGTGGGKTFSAMRLAAGISGDKPFAVIDTEAGRAKHYADQFKFDHGDLRPPFTPKTYAEAILAADAAGYPCIVVDSCTHEWSGEGGVLDMQEAELDRMAGDDWKKREACRMSAWIKPKGEHKKMVQRLLQVRAHLILCFRAEEKVEMVKGDDGKMKIMPKASVTGLDGWIPVCEKNLPYELTVSFLLLATNPGIPHSIKLQNQHKVMFPDGKHIDEEAGKRVAAWASGGAAPERKVIAPLSKDEIDELISTLDVKTRPALVSAYNAGVAVLKERGNAEQFAKFKSWRDEMLAGIEAGTIT
jgi:AAA domain